MGDSYPRSVSRVVSVPSLALGPRPASTPLAGLTIVRVGPQYANANQILGPDWYNYGKHNVNTLSTIVIDSAVSPTESERLSSRAESIERRQTRVT